jgi:hypothetical protein
MSSTPGTIPERSPPQGRPVAWPQHDPRRNRCGCLPRAYLMSGARRPHLTKCLILLARPRGFEPLTFAFGGQRSKPRRSQRRSLTLPKSPGALPVVLALASGPAAARGAVSNRWSLRRAGAIDRERWVQPMVNRTGTLPRPRGYAGPSLLAVIVFEKDGQHVRSRFRRQAVPRRRITVPRLAKGAAVTWRTSVYVDRTFGDHDTR